jgi:hypothetical protein
MDAPTRVSPDLANMMVDRWLAEKTYCMGSQNFCVECHEQILWNRAYLSVHYSSWTECVGSGEVLNPTIPYCPNCEPGVSSFGCIHIEPQKILISPAAPRHEGFFHSWIERIAKFFDPKSLRGL